MDRCGPNFLAGHEAMHQQLNALKALIQVNVCTVRSVHGLHGDAARPSVSAEGTIWAHEVTLPCPASWLLRSWTLSSTPCWTQWTSTPCSSPSAGYLSVSEAAKLAWPEVCHASQAVSFTRLLLAAVSWQGSSVSSASQTCSGCGRLSGPAPSLLTFISTWYVSVPCAVAVLVTCRLGSNSNQGLAWLMQGSAILIQHRRAILESVSGLDDLLKLTTELAGKLVSVALLVSSFAAPHPGS
jgi:hypothetical protein